MVHFAHLGPAQFAQSRDIARSEKLPNKFLESVLLGLKRAGYLDSKVGSGGGYRLKMSPRDITLGDLVRRFEAEEPLEAPPADESISQTALRLLQHRLQTAHASVLDAVTLEQLRDEVRSARGDEQEMFYI